MFSLVVLCAISWQFRHFLEQYGDRKILFSFQYLEISLQDIANSPPEITKSWRFVSKIWIFSRKKSLVLVAETISQYHAFHRQCMQFFLCTISCITPMVYAPYHALHKQYMHEYHALHQ